MELRQYLDILKRHKWFIIGSVVVVALTAGILSSLRTPVYKGTARVLLTPNDPTQQLNPTSGNGIVANDADRYVAGQIAIAGSEAVAREAVAVLDGVTVKALKDKVSVTQSGQSNVVVVSAIDPDPTRARDIADAVAKGYIENRRKVAVSGLQGAADDIEARLGPLQAQIAQLDTQIDQDAANPGATPQLVSPVPPASSAPMVGPTAQPVPPTAVVGPSTAQEALKAARYAAAIQYETLYSRQQELLVDISLKRGDAELISAAENPVSPTSPKPTRDAALGSFIGLFIGVGVSVLREHLNDKIRTSDEVERLTGLPLLAQLPYDDDVLAGERLTVDQRPDSALSEAMRSMRTGIQYQAVDHPAKLILVTSSLPGEGKSLVAANLAASLAQADYRTVLISADLRRPSIDDVFGELAESPGLTGVIRPLNVSGDAHVANGHTEPYAMGKLLIEALVPTPVNGLLLLPAGDRPPNPAELLGSRRMASILDQLSATADIVVIDSPPVLPVTDAVVLAAKCDGIVLVTAWNETPRAALGRAQTMLAGTGTKILGVVVNKARKVGSGYHYSGGYYNEPRPIVDGLTKPTIDNSFAASVRVRVASRDRGRE